MSKLLTPLIACSLLALALCGAAPKAQAQAPQLVDCIETSSTPCNTTEPEGNGSQGDKLWLAAGKFNNDFEFLAPLWALPSLGFPCNPSGSADELGYCTLGSTLQIIDGVLNVTGVGGGGSNFDANGTPFSSTTTINFENSVTVNGITLTFSNPTLGNLQLGLGFPSGQTADEFLSSPCGSTGPLGLRVLCASDLPNTINANTTGNAATSSAFAGTPTVCTGGMVPTGINSSGNAIGCFTPPGSGISLATNNTADSSQSALNFENSVSANGMIVTVINPSAGNVQFGLSFPSGQTADEFLSSPCGSTGPLGLRVLCASDLPNTINANTTGNAATSSAFAGTPTVCTGGMVPTGINSSGNAIGCFTPPGSGISLATNNTADSSQSALNFENSATTNGVQVTAANPSAGNVQLGINFITGQVANEFWASPCGTTGAIVLRVLCASDLPNTINANTTGNAGSATQLATTPTQCVGAQVPTGILANGNATGCFTPSGSGVALETNSTANASQTALNLEAGGGVAITNSSGPNVVISASYSVRVVSGTTDTLLSSDCANGVDYQSSSSVAVTLPQATGSFASCSVDVIASGSGAVTVTPATSTITNTSSVSGTSLLVPARTSANITASSGNYVAAGPALNPTSGTVTSIACGTGLSGGTITTTGTCSLNLANANTWSAAQGNSTAGAASSPAQSFTGAPFTGGSGTTTYPLIYANDGTAPSSWSAAGTYWGTNAPSGFTGNFTDLHVNGGASVYSVNYQGNTTGGTYNGVTIASGSGTAAGTTGSFTTGHCADIAGVSPMLVGDAGAACLSTSSANTWSAAQTFQLQISSVNGASSATSVTPNCTYNFVKVTASAPGAFTINAPNTCTPVDGQRLELKVIGPSGGTISYSWNGTYLASASLALPTASLAASKEDYFSFQYDSDKSGWVFLAMNQEF